MVCLKHIVVTAVGDELEEGDEGTVTEKVNGVDD